MLVHPQFDPVALAIGPVADPLVRPDLPGRLRPVPVAGRAARAPRRGSRSAGWTRRDVEDLLFYGVLGVVIGGRLGYVLFYKPGYYLPAPAGDLGGVEGRHVVPRRPARRDRGDGAVRAPARRPFLQVIDLIAPCVPTGLASGRIGNFINGELWGRAADPSLPWAMVFPQSGSAIAAPPVAAVPVRARRPAAVRAAVAVRAQAARAPGRCRVPSSFGYGVLRFIAEYFREPDSFLGLRAGHEHGPVAVRADDRGRRCWCGCGPAGQQAGHNRPRMRQIFLDTETTGLSAEGGDRIIEIGCVEMVNRRLTGNNRHFYLNPRAPQPRRRGASPRPDRRVPGRQAAVRGRRRRAAGLPGRRRGHHPQRAPSTSASSTTSWSACGRPRHGRAGGADHRQPADGARDVPRQVRTRSTRCASGWRSTTPTARCTARCSTPACWPRSTSA